MILSILAYNLLVVLGVGLTGYLPCRFLERKTEPFGVLSRFFLSLVLGYFIVTSLTALYFTKGMTMQVLNLIPFLILFFLPDSHRGELREHQKAPLLLVPVSLLLFACWYFTRSYSYDLLKPDHYPFIDIVSYASTAYGMARSGTEVSLADAALYFPEPGRIHLYHFTELWASVGAARLFSVTELWAICFFIPVFLFVLIAAGLVSFPLGNRAPVVFTALMAGALCFSNAKLLFFQDIFLYNVLDLCGIKISLIIPVFLFLLKLKKYPQVGLSFCLWLPQVNILLGVLLAGLVILHFVRSLARRENPLTLPVWLGYGTYGVAFLALAFLGKGSQAGPEFLEFSPSLALKTFFNYQREAFFNLGFNYWVAFLFISSLITNRKHSLIMLAFLISKLVSKLMVLVFPGIREWTAVSDVLVLYTSVFFINRRFRIFPTELYSWFGLLVMVCLVGGIGYALTGFMDFEQIYTLYACPLFFILAFHLMDDVPGEAGLLTLLKADRFRWALASAALFFITWKTFRLQRVLPFDNSFYTRIRKDLTEDRRDKFSAYFSTRKYSPFPLHIKAGFPLMFTWSSAISTPVTMFDDSSWVGKDIAWHVASYPFYQFCLSQPGFQKETEVEKNQIAFLKKFEIRYLWIDQNYPKARLEFLKQALQKRLVSNPDKLEFWEIDPGNL